MERLRRRILAMKKLVKEAKFMNDDRRAKLRWLLETMEDVVLEEELTQGFFKNTRGGSAT